MCGAEGVSHQAWLLGIDFYNFGSTQVMFSIPWSLNSYNPSTKLLLSSALLSRL